VMIHKQYSKFYGYDYQDLRTVAIK